MKILELFIVAKFAKEQITPLIRKMESEGKLDDNLVKQLFDNGLMGRIFKKKLKIPNKYQIIFI
jgi:hypothetical protein